MPKSKKNEILNKKNKTYILKKPYHASSFSQFLFSARAQQEKLLFKCN